MPVCVCGGGVSCLADIQILTMGAWGGVPQLSCPPPLPLQASDRFLPYSAISTDAILSLDAHSSLSTSEVRTPKRSPVWVLAAPQIPGAGMIKDQGVQPPALDITRVSHQPP